MARSFDVGGHVRFVIYRGKRTTYVILCQTALTCRKLTPKRMPLLLQSRVNDPCLKDNADLKVKPSKTDEGRIVKVFKCLVRCLTSVNFPLYKPSRPQPFCKRSRFRYLIVYISGGGGSRRWWVRWWTLEGGLGLWRRTFFSSTMSLPMEKGDGTPSLELQVLILQMNVTSC